MPDEFPTIPLEKDCLYGRKSTMLKGFKFRRVIKTINLIYYYHIIFSKYANLLIEKIILPSRGRNEKNNANENFDAILN